MKYVTVDDYHFLCAGKRPPNSTVSTPPRRTAATSTCSRSPSSCATACPSRPPAGGRRLPGRAGPRRPPRRRVFRRHREVRHLAGNLRLGLREAAGWSSSSQGVLASPLIRTETYRDFHARHTTRGIIYLPTTSYIEMNEWTLPAKAAAVYDALVAREKSAGRYESSKPSCAAASGRTSSCATRSPTGCTSACWPCPGGWPPCRRRAPAALTDHLYRAQANDAYWHGLFGGLYLPHLRREVWRNLWRWRRPRRRGAAPAAGRRRRRPRRRARAVPRQRRAAGGGEAGCPRRPVRARRLCPGAQFRRRADAARRALLPQAGRRAAARRRQAPASPRPTTASPSRTPSPARTSRPDARPRRLFSDAWHRLDGETAWPQYAAGEFKAPLMSAASLRRSTAAKWSRPITLAGRTLQVGYRLRDVAGRTLLGRTQPRHAQLRRLFRPLHPRRRQHPLRLRPGAGTRRVGRLTLDDRTSAAACA
jgi:hypothetical protein